MSDKITFTADQIKAWRALSCTSQNIFLTGFAGSGKSFLIDQFKLKHPEFKVIASTGAAALLVGGSTFHSFFSLGAMHLRDELTINRAVRNRFLEERIQQTSGIIIDEISMLNGRTLSVANQICQLVRLNSEPWGGIRVIAVGDFAQLPPIANEGNERDWAFESQIWEDSDFKTILLKEIVRTKDPEFLKALHELRAGENSTELRDFLNNHVLNLRDENIKNQTSSMTHLFSTKAKVEAHNYEKLAEIDSKLIISRTFYEGKTESFKKAIQKNCPIPAVLKVKVGAKVMIRVNDRDGEYANGSVGTIKVIDEGNNCLVIELNSGTEITLGEHDFRQLDPDGRLLALARNFPITLAYACTIHKSQGMTLDEAIIDLRNLWEPGQAYVALSRLRSSEGLNLIGWKSGSILANQKVKKFYEGI